MPPKKILLADDDYSLRTALAARLVDDGFDLCPVVDGQEAINMLGSQTFDLILLDLEMPNVDGYGVLSYIKQNNLATKVLMLTGHSDLKNAIHSKKLGADDFISKPFEYSDLLTTMDRILNES